MITDTFTAVVTSHANEQGLVHMLGNLMYQTRPPDEILVFASDTPGLRKLRELFHNVKFFTCLNMNDWGHEKRSDGVAEASKDWLGFFNDDDSYDPRYIEKMLNSAGPGIDAVYCWWSRFPNGCAFQAGSSTSGNFIVRTQLAKEIGFNERDYEADGHFINAVANKAREIMVIPENLYHWNDPSNQRGE